ncbi:MAG: XTP/dITP diphosphatase [Dissulfurispiraceae bacterium]|jgi:XTP/dITP diphosphohydrolase
MELVFATRNKKKVEEVRRILADLNVSILTLDDFPQCPEVDEDAETFEGNAIKKAVVISKCIGMLTFSDDSGLEVYALNGAPGVKSARYAGDRSNDMANNEKLLDELADIGHESRGARFICIIAIAFPDGETQTFQGIVEGLIGKKPIGTMGFGYDPLFYPEGFDTTFGQMSPEEKDSVSHRRRALEKLKTYLKSL